MSIDFLSLDLPESVLRGIQTAGFTTCTPIQEETLPIAPRAFIVAPTRELAIQIHSDACLLGQYTGLEMQVVYGGVDYQKQREILRAGVDVLLGTPG